VSSIVIDLNTASTEQYAAQILAVLRQNQKGRPAGGYYPGSLEGILSFEFVPKAKGLDVRDGVWHQPGGVYAPFGYSDSAPDWLRDRFFDAVHWLRQHSYIRQDHTQSSDKIVELTAEGRQTEIEPATMTFVRPRDWTYWRSVHGDSVYHLSIRLADRNAGGTAFLIGEGRFATCAHNLEGTVVVYVGEQEVPIETPRTHPSADIAVFSVPAGVVLPGRPLLLNTALPVAGEEVAAFGYPAVPLRQPTLNILVGSVESLPTDYRGTGQFIQVSLGTSGGVSGGPLIDKCGRVVGVVSERTFEAVATPSIPAKAFPQVVPISYLGEIEG
jgi:S1-C subfamily serine protease